jgi:hypothetical protein
LSPTNWLGAALFTGAALLSLPWFGDANSLRWACVFALAVLCRPQLSRPAIYAVLLWSWAALTLLWTPDRGAGAASLMYGTALLLCLFIRAEWLPGACVVASLGTFALLPVIEYAGFGNKNFIVEFLIACLPWVLTVRFGWVLGIAILGYVFTADSHMAIVALLAPLAALVWAVRHRPFWVCFIVLGVVFVALMALQANDPMSSVMARAEIWINAAYAWLDRPYGWGVGSFDWVYPFYAESHVPWLGNWTQLVPITRFAGAAHNEPLHLLVELGPVGLVLAGLFVFSLKTDNKAAVWCLGLIAAMSLVEFPLRNPHTGLLAALSASFLLGSRSKV